MNEKIVNNRIKSSSSRITFVVINTVMMILLAFIFLFPFWNVIVKSLNNGTDTERGGLFLVVREFTWVNYEKIFDGDALIRAFVVTTLVSIGYAFWSVLITYAAAYAMAQGKIWGSKVVGIIFLLPTFLSGGLMAHYVVFAQLGILNTWLVYVFTASFSFYNMVIMRVYIQGVSVSYREAARIDGASEITIMFQIYIPLSMPIIATMFLWGLVGKWNDYTTNLYYVMDKDLTLLQMYLQQISQKAQKEAVVIKQQITEGNFFGDTSALAGAEGMTAATTVFATLPMLLVYLFLQKYFVKGVSLGGVKE